MLPACLLMARVFSVPSRTLPQGSVIYFPPPTCELAHHSHFPTSPPEGDPPTHTPHSHSLGIPEGTAALGWCSNTFFLSDRKEGKSTGGRERGRRGSRALVQLVLESAKFTLLVFQLLCDLEGAQQSLWTSLTSSQQKS